MTGSTAAGTAPITTAYSRTSICDGAGQLITQLFLLLHQPLTLLRRRFNILYWNIFRKASGTWAKTVYSNAETLQTFLRQLADNIRILPETNGLRDRMAYLSGRNGMTMQD
ncbi:hypothetical protein [Chitinophaga pinensis]|uniref:Uncharacterized protein n=1 Tax=Chitinophaga pinensis TaxID=79329 RepID=A0A5C6LLG6_9BACT|nr:hypothetical protein [Chitinophaga pinensis]TWV92749.1 hypothetical protein FEF09_28030 [Chitinophaga pinensis]